MVLACGGFPHDRQRLAQVVPHAAEGYGHFSAAPPDNQGEGIRLGESVGGQFGGNISCWPLARVTRDTGAQASGWRREVSNWPPTDSPKPIPPPSLSRGIELKAHSGVEGGSQQTGDQRTAIDQMPPSSGAVLRSDSGEIHVEAGAVVLACGGFPHDRQRLAQVVPHAAEGYGHFSAAPPDNQGA